MAKLGVHPRLAHLLLRGQQMGLGALAADIAAILGERDILRDASRDADLRHRIELIRGKSRAAQTAAQVAQHWRRQLRISGESRLEDIDHAGRLVALAYPDRIAQRRPGTRGQFRLSNGRGAVLADTDPLAASDFLAVAMLDGAGPSARIFLAAPVTEHDLRLLFGDEIRAVEFVTWNAREQAVQARRQLRLGELVLEDRGFDPAPEQISAAMLDGVHDIGLNALPWTDELRNLQARVAWLRRVEGASWPDLSDAALARTLETWLGPYLVGITRRSQLDRVDLGSALRALLSWDQQQSIARKAPTHFTVPSGSRLPIDYTAEEPRLSVRLQEMFGLPETPAVCDGHVPITLLLLSPAGRPVQVTRDLASFWQGAYHDVKRDLKGQYPKHHWPDDPLGAAPTRRAKRRGE